MRTGRLAVLASLVVAVAVACGSSSSDGAAQGVDAGADVVATPLDAGGARDSGLSDAGAACNLAAPFGTPTPVDGVNTPGIDWCPRLNDSSLEMYVTREVPESGMDLYRYLRASTAEPFGSPVALSALNSPAHEECAYVSADGLELFFDSRRGDSGSGDYDLYVATRSTPVAEFSNPTPLANVNTTEAEWWLWPSGDELFYTTKRGTLVSIFRAVRAPGGPYAAGSQIAEIHQDGGNEQGPSLTGDGLTMYFTRDRDLLVTTRPSRSDPFVAPHIVAELNTPAGASNLNGWISPNGCTIYFASSRNDGGFDIYTASKPAL